MENRILIVSLFRSLAYEKTEFVCNMIMQQISYLIINFIESIYIQSSKLHPPMFFIFYPKYLNAIT